MSQDQSRPSSSASTESDGGSSSSSHSGKSFGDATLKLGDSCDSPKGGGGPKESIVKENSDQTPSAKQQSAASAKGNLEKSQAKDGPGKSNEQTSVTEPSSALAPGPPPEASGGNRRSNRQHSRLNTGMRVPSLRGPSGLFGSQPGSAQFSPFRGGGRPCGPGPSTSSFPMQYAPPPPFGVQSYQHWATRSSFDGGGPRPFPCPPGFTAGLSNGGPTSPHSQAWSQPFTQPPTSFLTDLSVNQSLYWLRNLLPSAMGYLEANPDVDQALGLVVYRVFQGMSSLNEPPPRSTPNVRGFGRPGPTYRGRGKPSAPVSSTRCDAKSGHWGPSQFNFSESPSALPGSSHSVSAKGSWSNNKSDFGSPGPSPTSSDAGKTAGASSSVVDKGNSG